VRSRNARLHLSLNINEAR